MTSKVEVTACCDSETTEVEVGIYEGGQAVEKTTLQDGETHEVSVFDGRKILVEEVAKVPSADSEDDSESTDETDSEATE